MFKPMDDKELFSEPVYEQQTHMAERELSAFVQAVTELFGPEQARASTEDWLKESELTDMPPLSTERNWRSITIAAAARLAARLKAAEHSRSGLPASTPSEESPMLPSKGFTFALSF